MFDGDTEDFRGRGDGPFPIGSGPEIGTVEGAGLIAWALLSASLTLAIFVTITFGWHW